MINVKRGNFLMIWLLFAIYVTFSALGLTMIKLGAANVSFQFTSGLLNFKLDIKLILGMVFYVMSFLIFMVIMPKFNLSYIYPIAAGILYIIIVIFSVILLKEKISRPELIGMVLILAGIIAMNMKGK